MSCAEDAIEELLNHEGGSLITNDVGRGFSKWGWTERSLQELDPSTTSTTIMALNKYQASLLYQKYYWDKYSLSRIISCEVSTKLLDLMVNTGTGTAVKNLQRCLNAFFDTDLDTDGIMGDKTFSAINAANPQELLEHYRKVSADHYRSLVASNPSLEKFLNGWLTRLDA